MNGVISLKKKNETYLVLDSSDSGIIEELSAHFTFEVPGFRYMPAFKNGSWDGKIKLFNKRNHCLYSGLFSALQTFASSRGYTLDVQNDTQYGSPLTRGTSSTEWIDHIPLHANKQRITPKDYQIDAISHAIEHQRALLLSPTGSGKSLIIYLLCRWMMMHSEKKMLILVPTTSLVKQMKGDFLDYASEDESFTEDDIHGIQGGVEKTNKRARVYCSTWQSLYKLPSDYFNQFEMIVVDEAHTAKGASLVSVMEKATDVKYRFGTTGTLDNTPLNPLVLAGLFGPEHRVATTRELIDRKELADIDITILKMTYPDEIRKIVSKIEYHEEIDYIVTHEKRNRFLANLALSQEQNTLLLFNFVEKHGEPLYELIKRKAEKSGQTERKVFYISGRVEAEDRENIRKITESETNAIIVASSATCSVGMNIRNLHAVIFSSPSKSQIRVLQSIGRGLRKHGEGKVMKLFDLIDDFSWKNKKNYALSHGIERLKMYAKEGFPTRTLDYSL